MLGTVKTNAVPLGVAGGLLIAGGLILKNALHVRKIAKFRAMVAELDQNVVHIFAFPRMTAAANIAPAAIKLEAFCRINHVPYEMHFTLDAPALSPTETAPFVAIRGQLIGESQFCIDAIRSTIKIPSDEGLTPSQVALSTMVRRTCDLSLTQHQARTTIVDNAAIMLPKMVDMWTKASGMPRALVSYFVKSVRQRYIDRLNASGLGWLSDEAYQVEYVRDVESIAAVIAEAQGKGHKFLFGEKPTTADCVIYSVVSSINTAPDVPNNASGLKSLKAAPSLQQFAKDFEALVFPDLAEITPLTVGCTNQKFLHP